MSAESKPLTHPGTWLPGDQVTGARIWTRGDQRRWHTDADRGDLVRDEDVDRWVTTPHIRITHLVPRPVPSPASSGDARRMLAARQEGAPVLPDTSGWVKREPGDVIEAGTPYLYRSDVDGAIGYKPAGRGMDFNVDADMPGIYLTPPPSAPSPVDAIPVGRNNAVEAWLTFDYGNTGERVLGLWWRGEDDDMSVWRSRDEKPWSARAVRKVEPLHVIPAELAEEIKAWEGDIVGRRNIFDLHRDVAVKAEGEGK